MTIIDKVAIVTGASSGIGKATAERLTAEGAKVVLAARSKDKLEKLAKSLPGSLVVVTDMSKTGDIQALVAKTIAGFSRIDILVNNAGRGYDATIEHIKPDLYRSIFDLNVVGPLLAMQLVIPSMRQVGGGAIVNISSGTARMALPGMAAYSSLKRALVGVSFTAREELIRDKIKVSLVYPYLTNTDFEKNTLKEKADRQHAKTGDADFQLPDGDPPELVAQLIVDAIKGGAAEIFAHDWMDGSH